MKELPRLYQDAIEDFKLYNPYYAKQAVEYKIDGRYCLAIKLEDGSSILYDIFERSIRNLPNDRYSMTDDEYKHEFGARLRRIMFYKGIGQAELSEHTGIAQPLISKYINGKTMPSLKVLDRLAMVLDCSIEEFLYLDK